MWTASCTSEIRFTPTRTWRPGASVPCGHCWLFLTSRLGGGRIGEEPRPWGTAILPSSPTLCPAFSSACRLQIVRCVPLVTGVVPLTVRDARCSGGREGVTNALGLAASSRRQPSRVALALSPEGGEGAPRSGDEEAGFERSTHDPDKSRREVQDAIRDIVAAPVVSRRRQPGRGPLSRGNQTARDRGVLCPVRRDESFETASASPPPSPCALSHRIRRARLLPPACPLCRLCPRNDPKMRFDSAWRACLGIIDPLPAEEWASRRDEMLEQYRRTYRT